MISGIDGQVKDIIADPEYFDISMEQDVSFSVPVKPGYTASAYVIGVGRDIYQKERIIIRNELYGKVSSQGCWFNEGSFPWEEYKIKSREDQGEKLKGKQEDQGG